MNLYRQQVQKEDYYRKMLLLDKVKPRLCLHDKQYIFNRRYCWDILFKDSNISKLAFMYARDILKGPFPEGEQYILKSPRYAAYYAIMILKTPWPEAEDIISTDSYFTCLYIKHVLKKEPFPKGEKIISTNPNKSIWYVEYVLKDRFPLAEETILNSMYKEYYLKLLETYAKYK